MQSPRDVATYDEKPQMSAPEAAAAFVGAWREDHPGFGIINFANADMVGHTGVIPAAVQAVETVDRCLGEVVDAVHAAGGVCVITADHGNADNMLEPDGSPNTAHSLNPVPVIVTSPGLTLRDGGVLADVAPTRPRGPRGRPAGRDVRPVADRLSCARGGAARSDGARPTCGRAADARRHPGWGGAGRGCGQKPTIYVGNRHRLRVLRRFSPFCRPPTRPPSGWGFRTTRR